jgi:hypothetical protein
MEEYYATTENDSVYTIRKENGKWIMYRKGAWHVIVFLAGENLVKSDKIADYRQFVGSIIRFDAGAKSLGATSKVKTITKKSDKLAA